MKATEVQKAGYKEYYRRKCAENNNYAKEKSKKWREKNPERAAAHVKKDLAKKCVYREEHYGEPAYHIANNMKTWKHRCKIVELDLTSEYLLGLWNSQGGRCYYTGELMSFGNREVTQNIRASLDRLVPEKGYVKGNVVWCTCLVNTMKNKLSEDKFYEMMKRILLYKGKI